MESTQDTPLNPLEQYAAFPFQTSTEYQQGLESLISSGALPNELSQDDRHEALRRTRVFFFNHSTGNSLTVAEVRAYELSKQALEAARGDSASSSSAATAASNCDVPSGDAAPGLPTHSSHGTDESAGQLQPPPPLTATITTSAAAAVAEEEAKVLTFAQLQELIETGRVDEIPNNRIIPEALNDAIPTQSTAPARKKPWEQAVSAQMADAA